jgi:Flp pilus assembly pilin Flp
MERGQATVEYVAVVTVLAVVLAAALGVLPGAAREIPDAVAAAIHRAICVVSGGDCFGAGGPRPCVLGRASRAHEKHLAIGIGRLADGRVVVREERSDGTVAVTVGRFDSAGVGIVAGAEASVGGRQVKGSLEAVVSGRAGDGRRWVLPDGAAADRLIERLAEDDGGVGGGLGGIVDFARGEGGDGADERFVRFGVDVEATGALEALGLGASARGLRALSDGVRVDRRTGERTLFLERDHGVTGALTAPLTRLGGGLGREVGAELTFDRDGRPVRLLLRAAGASDGSAKMGPYASGRRRSRRGRGADRPDRARDPRARRPAARPPVGRHGARAGRASRRPRAHRRPHVRDHPRRAPQGRLGRAVRQARLRGDRDARRRPPGLCGRARAGAGLGAPAGLRARRMTAPTRPRGMRTCVRPMALYAELHAHSAFSFLDGTAQPAELAEAAVELGYETMALVDHNGVYGSMEFAQAARGLGLRAIHGAEVDVIDAPWQRPAGTARRPPTCAAIPSPPLARHRHRARPRRDRLGEPLPAAHDGPRAHAPARRRARSSTRRA